LLSPAQKWQRQLNQVQHQQLPAFPTSTHNVHCLTSSMEHATNTAGEDKCMHEDSIRKICSASMQHV